LGGEGINEFSSLESIVNVRDHVVQFHLLNEHAHGYIVHRNAHVQLHALLHHVSARVHAHVNARVNDNECARGNAPFHRVSVHDREHANGRENDGVCVYYFLP
jgi:hypothetical protein